MIGEPWRGLRFTRDGIFNEDLPRVSRAVIERAKRDRSVVGSRAFTIACKPFGVRANVLRFDFAKLRR